LQHKHLSVLHLGGNSFSGSIPNVPISAAVKIDMNYESELDSECVDSECADQVKFG
jgi:hypothetical protein